ncbi:MAG: basic amino acid ABC transporter substrate-binding protein [Actinobacteria bacterium]|nr:basic amino acid ABC transporter substrate-binding protein [Actinomycetota bacterium]
MRNKVLLAVGVFLLFTTLLMSSCAKQVTTETEETTTQETAAQETKAEETKEVEIVPPPTIKPGVLTVGSDATWPPMEYVKGDKIVGFDVDMAQAIADKLNLELDYQNTAWDGLFPALIAHKFDIAISSITITDERKQEMDFSIPYYKTDQAVTMREDALVDSVEKMDGKKAGVQIGTTGELAAKEIKGLTVNTYDDILLAFEDLKTGRIDAVISDSYVGYAYAVNNEGLKVAFVITTNEELGIAFAKDTPELLKAVNGTLQSLFDDGTYDSIYEKWFGEK